MPPDWINVTSSTISRIRWDMATQTLEIEFNSGQVYQYFDVPQSVFEGLRDAASQGTYLNQNIKGRFRYTRL